MRRVRQTDSKRGMALPVTLAAILCSSVVIFGIAQYQVHETRWTGKTIDQQRAFLMADAGLSRALARAVARPYAKRWYGSAPKDDLLPGSTHAGLFDEASQCRDETGASTPPGPDQKLDRRGTYSVLVEDRFTGELKGEHGVAESGLAFTDIFSSGAVEGPHGTVRALLFARLAIAPEVNYFTPSETAPESIKRIIRYKVYFEPDVADRRYEAPGTDTADLRNRIQEEVALYQQNFLRNRLTFTDLRKKVDANWNAPAAGKTTYTAAETEAFFRDIAPIQSNGYSSNDPASLNQFADSMLRLYRLSDALEPNQGIKYVINAQDVPSPDSEMIAANILKIFHNQTLEPIPNRFLPNAANPVTDGNELLQLQQSQNKIDEPRDLWARDVSSWQRVEASARIPQGHFVPYPTPVNPPPPAPPLVLDPATIAKGYQDTVFIDSFKTPTPVSLATMRAECDRANAMGATPPINPTDYIYSPEPTVRFFPIQLEYQVALATGTVTRQIPVNELMRFYYKYIETGAVFAADTVGGTLGPPIPTSPGTPGTPGTPGSPGTPASPGANPGNDPLPPAADPAPPQEQPDPPPPGPPGPGGGGTSGGGASNVGPVTIGGSGGGI